MKKNILVPLATGFEEIEAVTIIDILRRAGLTVTCASVQSDTRVTGSHGITLQADILLSDADMLWDGCVLPGGMPGAINLASNKKLNNLLINLHKENKLIGAICASPAVVLAPLGLIKGKRITGYPEFKNVLIREGNYDVSPVVTDGMIITSRSPATALEFALTIVKTVCSDEMSGQLIKGLAI